MGSDLGMEKNGGGILFPRTGMKMDDISYEYSSQIEERLPSTDISLDSHNSRIQSFTISHHYLP